MAKLDSIDTKVSARPSVKKSKARAEDLTRSSDRSAAVIELASPIDAQDAPKRGSVDFVVSEIIKDLCDGRLVPGQKLLESELAQACGVGRGSVREALRKLEAHGLVSVNLHRGANIRFFSRDGARDLLEVTENLVGLAARWAGERIGGSEEAEPLRLAVDAFTNHLETGNTFVLTQIRFHFVQELVSLSRNQELAKLVPRYDITVLRSQFRTQTDLREETVTLNEFRRVFELVLSRDGVGAERIMRRGIRRFANRIQQMPDRCFAEDRPRRG